MQLGYGDLDLGRDLQKKMRQKERETLQWR